jgi:hypothetical protein
LNLLRRTVNPVDAVWKIDAPRDLGKHPGDLGPRRRRGAFGAVCTAKQELWQMRVMAFASQNSGSGKTTLAGNIGPATETA